MCLFLLYTHTDFIFCLLGEKRAKKQNGEQKFVLFRKNFTKQPEWFFDFMACLQSLGSKFIRIFNQSSVYEKFYL